jgi:DNA repair protein RadC
VWGPFYFKSTNMTALTQTAELTVSYQVTPDWSTLPVIGSSEDAYRELFKLFPQNTVALQEHFIVCYLNRANKMIGIYQISSGGITGTVCDPRIILGTALKVAAVSIVLSHNHPSGNLKASTADIELTKRLVEAGKLMDINVLDHLIVSPEDGKYLSFADQGLM